MPVRLSLLAIHPLLSVGTLKYAFIKAHWSRLTPSTDKWITPLKAHDPTADSTVDKLGILSILWEWVILVQCSFSRTCSMCTLVKTTNTRLYLLQTYCITEITANMLIPQTQLTHSNSTHKQWLKVQRKPRSKSNEFILNPVRWTK